MDLLSVKRLIKNEDGYTLELHINQELSEFAKDFDTISKAENKTLENAVRDFVQENFSGLKIKSVKVVLGSLLIASIPFADIEASASTNNMQSYNQATEIYTVKSGDTLYKIANKYGITATQLKSQNGLATTMIYPGQTIHIPDRELIDIVNSLPYGVLSLNDRGENVKIIQKAFNRLNYVLSEDGVYDKGTQAVVKDFQSKYGDIANDGIYGSKTRAYLQDALLTDHIIVENPDSLLVLVNKNNALPKDYVPQDLTVPNVNFPFQEYDSKKLMRKDAATALEEMFREAKRENINLYAVSGYRSYDRQNEIFASKVIRSGMESAGQFSAKPGESEHQTGLAMDLTSPSVNYGLSQQFGETKEGQWIKKNAHKFGFIIRYQKGKESITGYQFEPWHVRYVGKNAAQVIAEQNLTFEEYINNSTFAE
ncbi:D-alanyl-D-alanine carboxypeptidase family protein [Schinkia azotoformans]|uniref:D-alanyl-D-alanine carboxypeptidase family protein n=1 Tax=Schinkia azotoformans TaxID=1454 RepID=UPI002E1B6F09|nr:D-alanyl-D-alanine carboxypeptidase family protein [Schinkia azotoformans]MED4354975.1 D-alanyl-D-alanine carboxypeptidase family protein [Schinkia azotoformans]